MEIYRIENITFTYPERESPALNDVSLVIRRGDFVLMLYRAAGQPVVSEPESFTDVNPQDYYAGAVAWAKATGISTGVGNDLFDPTGTLSREQAFTFVYRALAVFGKSFTDGSAADLSQFSDAGVVADYAAVPAATLVRMGIVSGADGKILPGGVMTRSQMAKILCMVLQYNQ